MLILLISWLKIYLVLSSVCCKRLSESLIISLNIPIRQSLIKCVFQIWIWDKIWTNGGFLYCRLHGSINAVKDHTSFLVMMSYYHTTLVINQPTSTFFTNTSTNLGILCPLQLIKKKKQHKYSLHLPMLNFISLISTELLTCPDISESWLYFPW